MLYILTVEAEADLRSILKHTLHDFGEAQMLKYNAQIIDGFVAVSEASGFYKRIKRRGRFVRCLHCQKHYIFALERKDGPVLIIAILHEKMDLVNRLRSRL